MHFGKNQRLLESGKLLHNFQIDKIVASHFLVFCLCCVRARGSEYNSKRRRHTYIFLYDKVLPKTVFHNFVVDLLVDGE